MQADFPDSDNRYAAERQFYGVCCDTLISDNLTTSMNAYSISQAVKGYFTSRANYLLGQTTAEDWSVVGIVSDEATHLAQYNAKGIVLQNTTYTVDDTQCYDTYASVTAIETITYMHDGIICTENVIHELTLYLNSENVPDVAADAYVEACSDFVSCSYVDTTVQTFEATTTTAAGSGLCIVEIAKNEVGTQETYDNLTKYGEWFGWNGVDWCAIFICWCANQANVDPSIIPNNLAGTYTYQDFFRQRENYYLSQSYGGTYTPQPGDIIFIGAGMYAPTHVGIVEKVEDGNVHIYDGNWQN